VPFKKILIANRGEIAIRILRSCRELGIETVSVHSTADESSLHVKLADESVCIGPPKSALSYLSIPAILSAAEITGADAIHPGFGFLSENTDFAAACEKWNIAFIGPNSKSIERMGDKILSKRIARKAGVPILEPIRIKNIGDKKILADVEKMGLPVLIKASAGGGGRGMQRIDNMDQLLPAIERLKTEAKNGFGDDTLFIEKYITNPRHIEVQIVADKHGNVVHLGERDCTIQRRFQKILEESPSPSLGEKRRREICNAAANLAKFVRYDSVGTVEFLYDQDTDKYYFMEMNTRIQVEHPVTELRTGIDLIAQQIKIAANEKLPFRQKDIVFNGHSMECRINAEDPHTMKPCPGKILYYYRPGGIGVRVDDFIYTGYQIPPFYDSMLAKVIVHASGREECIARMQRALSEMIIEGISTNISLHQRILKDPDFRGNIYATNFLALKMK
jgi:acetyl-CoA carboxylase, biotin carboxylase subunit